MVLRDLDNNMQKNETGPLCYTIDKNKFKVDEKPKYEIGNHQILEKKRGKNLFDLSHINFLLHMSLKTREIKAKMND